MPESGPIRVTARRGPCVVDLEAPAAEAMWQYRLPEAVTSDEGVFKFHAHPIVTWAGPEGDGSIWHAWETNDADFVLVRAYQNAAVYGLQFIQGLRYRATIRPVADGLDLLFAATNLSPTTLHHLFAFPCLGFPSGNFRDPGLERTFVITAHGMTALRHTDRGTGDPIRSHYVLQGHAPVRNYAQPFWGDPSRTAIQRGDIVRARADGAFAVGTTWECAGEVFDNQGPQGCMHSVPVLDTLDPGETRAIRGKIVFVAGGPEMAFDRLDAWRRQLDPKRV
jgi:hypothetical protein